MDLPVNGELIPQGGGDSIALMRTPLVLGRRESCDVCLQFPNVSSKHCELTFKDGFWVIRDLGSTNGTKVNGLPIHRKVIRTGDTLTIGRRHYQIHYVESGQVSDLDGYENELGQVMNVSLLEKSGLAHPPKYPRPRYQNPNLASGRGAYDDDDDD